MGPSPRLDERQRLLGRVQVSGLPEGETLRTVSLLLTVMGVAGILVTRVLATVLPLA